MVVGVLEVSIHIPTARSLKDKRQVIRSLKDRVRHRFNVSLTETDGQDTWQRCGLAFAMIAVQQSVIEKDMNRILDLIDSYPAIDRTDYWIDYY